jgi:hypothetical protein
MGRAKENWPDWWSWELDCSNPHLAKRMIDRGFNETDLRDMLERSAGYRPVEQEGRWVIECSLAGRSWEVIVEPHAAEILLIVVTAYSIG